MKITKAKLKQIIQEELSSLSEAGEVSYHTTPEDWLGTGQVYNPDVEGLPPEEQVDPVKRKRQALMDLEAHLSGWNKTLTSWIDQLRDKAEMQTAEEIDGLANKLKSGGPDDPRNALINQVIDGFEGLLK